MTETDIPSGGSGDLGKRAGKAVGFSALGNWVTTALALISLFVVARLLGPGPFGEFALISACLALPQAILTSSLNESIIQRENLEKGHLDTTFALSMGIALAAVILIAVLAKPVLGAMGVSHLLVVMLVMASALVIEALMTVPSGLIQRSLRYDQFSVIDVASATVALLCAIVAAIVLESVWALVIAELARRIVRLVLIFHFSKWRPGTTIGVRYLRDLASFNTAIAAITLMQTYVNELPRIIVGAAFGTISLGLYNLAMRLHDQSKSILVNPIGAVALPVASELAREKSDPTQMITAGIRLSSLIAYPAFIGLAVIAPAAIPLLFGDQWTEAIPLIQIVMIMALRTPSNAMNSGILRGFGEVKRAVWVQVFSVVLVTALTVLLVPYGLTAVMWGLLFQRFATWGLSAYFVQRVTGFSSLKQVTIGWEPLVSSLIMAMAVWGLMMSLGPVISSIPLVLLSILIGGLVYFVIILILQNDLRAALKQLRREGRLKEPKHVLKVLLARLI